jgi:hypothetical protein
MWKTRAGQAAGDNMEHAQCTLDTHSYKHTPRKCNTYCLSTAEWLHDLRLKIALYNKLSVLHYM